MAHTVISLEVEAGGLCSRPTGADLGRLSRFYAQFSMLVIILEGKKTRLLAFGKISALVDHILLIPYRNVYLACADFFSFSPKGY